MLIIGADKKNPTEAKRFVFQKGKYINTAELKHFSQNRGDSVTEKMHR